MPAPKLPGFGPGSHLPRLSQQAVARLKRVPLPWWQAVVVLLLVIVLANSLAKLLLAVAAELEIQPIGCCHYSLATTKRRRFTVGGGRH